ncbi:Protein of unknown function [Pyronema omphalodes CBS 100304]|uniref:Uncharacterized protein n=1 Tax=Pyronema omphalodes (strain CBS 100304) TaxID=1076935 RepID=U4LCL9_PYROM|nr:Protein of unknown function [Pyronema omphalodes CBS 100304]
MMSLLASPMLKYNPCINPPSPFVNPNRPQSSPADLSIVRQTSTAIDYVFHN